MSKPDVVILAWKRRESASAVLIAERGTGREVWLPRKQVRIETGGMVAPQSLSDLGEMLRITLPAWLAEEKGLGTEALAGQGRLL